MKPYRLTIFPSLDALPESAATLLDRVGDRHLFTSRLWFETFIAAGLAADTAPLLLALSDSDGNARALLPCQRLGADRGAGGADVASLTNFYSCDFRPLVADGADPLETAHALGQCIAQHFKADAVIRFDSLNPSLPAVCGFLDGLTTPGRARLTYDHFGGWTENVRDMTFDAYLGQRNGALREVLRRKGNRLNRANGSFEIIENGDIDAALAEYDAVYAQSWKTAEPWPSFQPTLIRALAQKGWLRLAVCRLDGLPIAVQLWTVVDGHATVLKLAHVSACDGYSPGSLLTGFAIRAIMERDSIHTLDFGRGDDDYKRAWTGRRTQYVGVLSASVVRRPLLVARHWLSRLRR